MATIDKRYGKRKHPKLVDFRGQIGKTMVVKGGHGNMVYLTNYPDMSAVKPSGEQRVRRDLFAEAVAYALKVKKDPHLSASYALALNGKRNIYQAALSDYMRMAKESK